MYIMRRENMYMSESDVKVSIILSVDGEMSIQ